jgi:hypothetical protein
MAGWFIAFELAHHDILVEAYFVGGLRTDGGTKFVPTDVIEVFLSNRFVFCFLEVV